MRYRRLELKASAPDKGGRTRSTARLLTQISKSTVTIS